MSPEVDIGVDSRAVDSSGLAVMTCVNKSLSGIHRKRSNTQGPKERRRVFAGMLRRREVYIHGILRGYVERQVFDRDY